MYVRAHLELQWHVFLFQNGGTRISLAHVKRRGAWIKENANMHSAEGACIFYFFNCRKQGLYLVILIEKRAKLQYLSYFGKVTGGTFPGTAATIFGTGWNLFLGTSWYLICLCHRVHPDGQSSFISTIVKFLLIFVLISDCAGKSTYLFSSTALCPCLFFLEKDPEHC